MDISVKHTQLFALTHVLHLCFLNTYKTVILLFWLHKPALAHCEYYLTVLVTLEHPLHFYYAWVTQKSTPQ
jgi:hypothetical protein